MNGFFINWLRLTGSEKQPAEVGFEPGLNVVWGASQTGKSFVFSCIDFMLGRSKPPKPIGERKGYDSAWLGLTIRSSGERFVLERGLPGGDYNLHSVRPGSWETTDSRTILAEHDSDRIDTISHFLLAASGLDDALILTKKALREIRHISFRDIAHLIFVDEERIIAERPPVYPTGQYGLTTRELATFSYLISGSDWKGVIAAADMKVVKATWRGKNELYEHLIAHLKAEVGDNPPTVERIAEQIAASDARIADVTSKIEESSRTISTMMDRRRRGWEDAQKGRTRLAVIDQLRDRFEQLQEHYKSDMDRLNFIAEGDFLLAQLGMAHCPYCGDPMEDHSAERVQQEAVNGSIQEAAEQEIKKIAANIRDLEQTMRALSGEYGDLGTHVSKSERAVSQAEQVIRDELEPQLIEDKNELAEMVVGRGKLIALKGAIERLAMLCEGREAMGQEPKQKRKTAEPKPSPNPDPGNLYRLAGEIAAILKDWRYLKDGTVNFDNEWDLVVNGEPRANHGKGIRAVLHSAFTIGLMNYCVRSPLHHPGLVLLDSPLTSYKEKEYQAVTDDIKVGFFESLLKLGIDRQVIVFENKEPPENLLPLLSGHHFTGSEQEGRMGFIP